MDSMGRCSYNITPTILAYSVSRSLSGLRSVYSAGSMVASVKEDTA